MKTLSILNISKINISAAGESRSFSIHGQNGAGFLLQVVNSSGQFYNFKSKTFPSINSSRNNFLKSKISGSSYNGKITFPAASGVTYNVILVADPATDTVLPRQVINTGITQVANTSVSVLPITNNGDNITGSFSATTSTDSPTKKTTKGTDVEISYTINNIDNDTHGFGLILNRQPNSKDFVFRNTQTVNGAISSTTEVVLDAITDLAVGTYITAVSSGSLSGKPFITKINKDTKTITLSAAQTFADGITLTFDAIGPKGIYNAIGLSLDITNIAARETVLTKTVRAAVSSSTTITLDGTYGIAKGATIKGADVNNSSANAVQSVSASSTAGSMVVQVNQTLEENSKLYFKGCTDQIVLSAKVNIKAYPSASRTINIMIDNFITPGVGS